MLKIENINTGYDKKQVLFDLSMDIQAGEIVSIIGPNGAGKSTILKAISGLLPIWNGDIVFNDNSIKGNSPSKNIAFGLTFCPQGNRVFDELNVLENLEIGGYLLSKKQLKVSLHLYKDMNIEEEMKFWSKCLNIPITQFYKPYIKKTNKSDINHKGGFGHGTCNVELSGTISSDKTLMGLKVISDYFLRKKI